MRCWLRVWFREHPPAPLTRLPPALARLRRLAGGRTLWPVLSVPKGGSTGALDLGHFAPEVWCTPLRRFEGGRTLWPVLSVSKGGSTGALDLRLLAPAELR